MSTKTKTNENAAGQAISAELETAAKEAVMATSNFFALPLLSDPSSSSDWAPKVGDIVANFGQVARVLGPELSSQGEVIGIVLREMGGSVTWGADPAKCRPVL